MFMRKIIFIAKNINYVLAVQFFVLRSEIKQMIYLPIVYDVTGNQRKGNMCDKYNVII